jgi:hypothetical protein
MKKFQTEQLIFLQFFFLSFIFISTTAEAAIVPVSHSPSIMKVIIDGAELTGERVAAKEYKINDRYFLSPSFISGDYFSIIGKLDSILQKKEILKSSFAKAIKTKLAQIRESRTPASTDKLDKFNEKNTVMLEYVTVGSGKRMVTNIEVAAQ